MKTVWKIWQILGSQTSLPGRCLPEYQPYSNTRKTRFVRCSFRRKLSVSRIVKIVKSTENHVYPHAIEKASFQPYLLRKKVTNPLVLSKLYLMRMFKRYDSSINHSFERIELESSARLIRIVESTGRTSFEPTRIFKSYDPLTIHCSFQKYRQKITNLSDCQNYKIHGNIFTRTIERASFDHWYSFIRNLSNSQNRIHDNVEKTKREGRKET